MPLRESVDLDPHRRLDHRGVHAVHAELQPLAEEGVLLLGDLVLESEDALAAGDAADRRDGGPRFPRGPRDGAAGRPAGPCRPAL